MTKILTITNQKGGVAKTTTAHALGIALMLQKQRVLFVDLDAQANLSMCMNVENAEHTSLELLKHEKSAREAITETMQGDIIPASAALAGADLELNETGKEFRLREALEPVLADYDYIIIDTPPALGILTVNALTAATGVIIPAQADEFSMQGIVDLYSTIQTVRRYCNKELRIEGILLTRHNPRTSIGQSIQADLIEIAKQLGTKVYDNYIRECIALREAQVKRMSIFTYSRNCNAATDYEDFASEVLND